MVRKLVLSFTTLMLDFRNTGRTTTIVSTFRLSRRLLFRGIYRFVCGGYALGQIFVFQWSVLFDGSRLSNRHATSEFFYQYHGNFVVDVDVGKIAIVLGHRWYLRHYTSVIGVGFLYVRETP